MFRLFLRESDHKTKVQLRTQPNNTTDKTTMLAFGLIGAFACTRFDRLHLASAIGPGHCESSRATNVTKAASGIAEKHAVH